MNLCPNPQAIKPNLSRAEATPALTVYMSALRVYQQERTPKGRAALFRSYRRWIGTFLDDDAEANRAAVNFLVALRNQPSQPPEMGAAA